MGERTINFLLVLFFLSLVVESRVLAEEKATAEWYTLGNRNVAFHLVLSDVERGAAHGETKGVSLRHARTLKGKKQRLVKEALIASVDIEGVEVQQSSAKDKSAKVIFHLKRASWKRVSESTRRHVGRSVALRAGDYVLSEATLRDRLVYKVVVPGLSSEALAVLLGNFDKRASAFEDANEDDYLTWIFEEAEKSDSPQQHLEAASLLMARDRYQQSITLLEPLVEDKNSDGYLQSVMLLGQAYAALKEYGKGIGVYEQAVRKDPGAWMLRKELASLYEARGDFRLASIHYRALIQRFEVLLSNCGVEKEIARIRQSELPTAMKNKLLSDLEEQLRENERYLAGSRQ